MKRVLLWCLPFLSLTAQAQDMGTISDGFDVEKFPTVSFVYHVYSPEELAKSDIQFLKEGGEERGFEFAAVSENHSDEPMNTLILWEDMANHGRGQFVFTKNVLSAFFDDMRSSSRDKFTVATFNRRGNSPFTLNSLTRGMTDDKILINRAINNYVPSRSTYPEFSHRSDAYSAIREGLDLLQPLEGAKSIIVFTAGYPMENSGADSQSQVLLLAQRLHIPVYIMQYYERSGVTPGMEGFAVSTNGAFVSYRDNEAARAKSDLISLYQGMRDRYFGQSYRITFESGARRGGEARTISLGVPGGNVQEQLIPPPFSMKKWIKDNTGLFVGLIILVVAVIGAAVWLIIRRIANRKKEMAEREAEMQSRISDSDRKLEAIKLQQDQEKRRERDAVEKKARAAEKEKLESLMRTKNLYPRLQCRVGNETFNYTMGKPRITLGRDDDNDVVLNDARVSRHHAEITFTGGGFEIVDTGSTNKVVINGAFFERATLKSGDVIGLGEAVVTFYV